jgi:hypothetical protein
MYEAETVALIAFKHLLLQQVGVEAMAESQQMERAVLAVTVL